MRKILLMVALATSVYSYDIGGAYASLIDCTYGQYGYEYGHIGTYKANGQIYRIFFKNSYCEY